MANRNDQTPLTGELSDKQKRLLGILVETPNIQEAADVAGISRSTAHRWLRDPAFKEELTSMRKTSMEDAMNTVHSYTARAVEGLVDLMDTSNDWLRRQVCMDILNRALKIREAEDLEGRIAALEDAVKNQKQENHCEITERTNQQTGR